MDHRYFSDRVSAWHDMGLPVMEQELIGQHLEACEECRALLEQIRALDRLAQRHSTFPDGEYWERLATRIDRTIEGVGTEERTGQEPQQRIIPIWRWVGAAASILLVSIVGYNYFIENPEPKLAEPKSRRLEAPSTTSPSPSLPSASQSGDSVSAGKQATPPVPAPAASPAEQQPSASGLTDPDTPAAVSTAKKTSELTTTVPSQDEISSTTQETAEPTPAVQENEKQSSPVTRGAREAQSTSDSSDAARSQRIDLPIASPAPAAMMPKKNEDAPDSLAIWLAISADYWSLFIRAEESSRYQDRGKRPESAVRDSADAREKALTDSTLYLLQCSYHIVRSDAATLEQRTSHELVLRSFSDDTRTVVADSARALLTALTRSGK